MIDDFRAWSWEPGGRPPTRITVLAAVLATAPAADAIVKTEERNNNKHPNHESGGPSFIGFFVIVEKSNFFSFGAMFLPQQAAKEKGKTVFSRVLNKIGTPNTVWVEAWSDQYGLRMHPRKS